MMDSSFCPVNASVPQSHQLTFYGRRKGRALTKTAISTVERVLPELSIQRWLAPHQWPDSVWLDIGCGSGEHMLDWLHKNPKAHTIGVEVFLNGLSQCINQLPLEHYKRCSLVPHMVQTLWPILPNHCLDGIWLFFADPWPKKRHHGRRLLQRDFLDQCARLLKPQGCLHVASDHSGLITHSLQQLHRHEAWVHVAGAQAHHTEDQWPHWPEDWRLTRYGQKAMDHGSRCMWTSWRAH